MTDYRDVVEELREQARLEEEYPEEQRMKIVSQQYGGGRRVWYVLHEGSFIAGPYLARDDAAKFIREFNQIRRGKL